MKVEDEAMVDLLHGADDRPVAVRDEAKAPVLVAAVDKLHEYLLWHDPEPRSVHKMQCHARENILVRRRLSDTRVALHLHDVCSVALQVLQHRLLDVDVR